MGCIASTVTQHSEQSLFKRPVLRMVHSKQSESRVHLLDDESRGGPDTVAMVLGSGATSKIYSSRYPSSAKTKNKREYVLQLLQYMQTATRGAPM